MQMLVNARSQWLTNTAKIPVNGKVYVYVDSSSTSLITLYSNAALTNEVDNPQNLDTSGRLEQTIYFKENSAFVVMVDHSKNVPEILFSFTLQGRQLSDAQLTLMSLEQLINSDVQGDCLIYHAKKIKYLKWVNSPYDSPNGITEWNNSEGTGGWFWETTVLDIWDIGIDKYGIMDMIGSVARVNGIAKFIVRSGQYYFEDDKPVTVDFARIVIEVELGVEFFFTHGGRAIWEINTQPKINSILLGISWFTVDRLDFRTSMLDSGNNGRGLASGSLIGKLYLDTDFYLNRVNALETIGQLTQFDIPPVLTGESSNTNAGKLTGIMQLNNVPFKEGLLSQMQIPTAAGSFAIRCIEKFTIDKNWDIYQNSITLSDCDVVINSGVTISGAGSGETTLGVKRITLGTGANGIGRSFSGNLNIHVSDTGFMLPGRCFDPNFPMIATKYLRQFWNAFYNVNVGLTIKDYYLANTDASLFDGATYINCRFGSRTDNTSQWLPIDGNKKLTFIDCEWVNPSGGAFNNVRIYPKSQGDDYKKVTFKNCYISGGLSFNGSYGGDKANIDIEDVSANTLSFNGDSSFRLYRGLREGDIFRIKNLTIRNQLGATRPLNYNTEGSILIRIADRTLENNNNSITLAVKSPSGTSDIRRPFPLMGFSSSRYRLIGSVFSTQSGLGNTAPNMSLVDIESNSYGSFVVRANNHSGAVSQNEDHKMTYQVFTS
jgi:hypothetical protein